MKGVAEDGIFFWPASSGCCPLADGRGGKEEERENKRFEHVAEAHHADRRIFGAYMGRLES